jgi:4-carboxymuconolactone decarboxylase
MENVLPPSVLQEDKTMRLLIWTGILILTAVSASAQTAPPANLPPDINPQSMSRLPAVQRQDLDERGQRVWDTLAGNNPRPGGILAQTIINPGLAEALRAFNTGAVREGTLGSHMNEVAILTATREMQMSPSEWTGHAAAALRAGVRQETIDVIKFGRDLAGVPDKDALVIRFGRELFRNKQVSAATFTRVLDTFGHRGTVDLVGVMGDYAAVALMFQAFGMYVPPERQLPPLNLR